ncbi:hypothetical protein COCSUDRAFT_61276 [Coccomyxa subellipsoidea C-169]|uniref:Uncharacterized protein n=1 Tax=Coccomyxa subellipsoidea (strain C-169) TaxID=574566 RepID=I0Z308_COCSC|nr:hypothetical protein COCSUDRAFT_61276 [Coccomyxa subellipsoidea C-169]EIE25027.1 hypothetical protein COCSUDRAFT_61276 [Coccomyxa subellipsoidea C-169]|eukprot:XP_005649571.1 hypothetical protein COCSUDRAFT_61276 [Coccomyxa subellipsoidea C-169]
MSQVAAAKFGTPKPTLSCMPSVLQDRLARTGQLGPFTYAHEHGCPFDPDKAIECAVSGCWLQLHGGKDTYYDPQEGQFSKDTEYFFGGDNRGSRACKLLFLQAHAGEWIQDCWEAVCETPTGQAALRIMAA